MTQTLLYTSVLIVIAAWVIWAISEVVVTLGDIVEEATTRALNKKRLDDNPDDCWNCRRAYPADHDGQLCISAPYPGATSNRYEPRGQRGWVGQ